jgi:tRNA(fMet)-specific endonuclease VapC
MAYLIDTDIIIFSLKNDKKINQWFLNNLEIPKFISVISYGELMYGARKSAHPNKNIATTNRIAELFPILDINKGIIEVFGEIKAKLEIAGTRLEDMDLLIASTAIYMNLSLVTNNKKHFKRVDDLIIEDWESDISTE